MTRPLIPKSSLGRSGFGWSLCLYPFSPPSVPGLTSTRVFLLRPFPYHSRLGLQSLSGPLSDLPTFPCPGHYSSPLSQGLSSLSVTSPGQFFRTLSEALRFFFFFITPFSFFLWSQGCLMIRTSVRGRTSRLRHHLTRTVPEV